MGVLIDTSALVRIERSGQGLLDLLRARAGDRLALSAVTAAELLHGVHRADTATRRARREGLIEQILARLEVLPFDLAVARDHARLWADLKAHGAEMSAHDLMIAATALHHDLDLLTDDAGFARVPGLRLLALDPP